MALRTTPAAIAPQRPSLTLLRGRKPDVRTAHVDARLEVVAFCDEVVLAMHDIHDAEICRDIPSARVLNEAGRIASKAVKARAEYLALLGGDAA